MTSAPQNQHLNNLSITFPPHAACVRDTGQNHGFTLKTLIVHPYPNEYHTPTHDFHCSSVHPRYARSLSFGRAQTPASVRILAAVVLVVRVRVCFPLRAARLVADTFRREAEDARDVE